MDCKHCLKFKECLEKTKVNENFAGQMYNMCFWENSDERCKDFTPVSETAAAR